MRRWGHPHTLGAGAILGFYAASHLVWAALAVFALGVAAGRFWWLSHWVAEAIRDKVLHARRVRGLRAPARAGTLPVDRIPY